MDTIIFYLKDILLELLPNVPIVVLICCIMAVILRKKRYKFSFLYELGVGLFMLYCVALFSETISIQSIICSITSGNIRIDDNINIIPFYGILQVIQSGELPYIVLNILGNILMFLPMGFFLPLLWKRLSNVKVVIFFGILISALIEISQLYICRGTDIDDLILNTVGTFMGYLSYRLINKLFPRFTSKFILKVVD